MVSASTVCGTAFGATITVDPGTVGDGCTTTGAGAGCMTTGGGDGCTTTGAGAGCTTTGGGDGCTTTGGVPCTMTSPAHAPPARTVSAMLPASTVRSMRLFIGVPPMGDRLVSVAARRSWELRPSHYTASSVPRRRQPRTTSWCGF